MVVYLSLTAWNGLGSPQWVGLDNWRALPGDDDVTRGLGVTLALTALCWATQTPWPWRSAHGRRDTSAHGPWRAPCSSSRSCCPPPPSP
ncbi:hypothetical protein HFP72_24155 [Nocardiopsis sp. ARC36]